MPPARVSRETRGGDLLRMCPTRSHGQVETGPRYQRRMAAGSPSYGVRSSPTTVAVWLRYFAHRGRSPDNKWVRAPFLTRARPAQSPYGDAPSRPVTRASRQRARLASASGRPRDRRHPRAHSVGGTGARASATERQRRTTRTGSRSRRRPGSSPSHCRTSRFTRRARHQSRHARRSWALRHVSGSPNVDCERVRTRRAWPVVGQQMGSAPRSLPAPRFDGCRFAEILELDQQQSGSVGLPTVGAPRTTDGLRALLSHQT